MFIAMDWHEAWWGVPCGPTLSMVHPPQLRGLKDIVAGGKTPSAPPAPGWWNRDMSEVGTFDLEAVLEKMRADVVDSVAPDTVIVLHPNTYARWKANGWIK